MSLSTNILALQFQADTKQAQQQIDQLSGKLNNFLKSNKTVGDVFSNLKDKIASTGATQALFAGAVVAAGVALKKIVSDAADYGNELQKMANRTGATVEELSRLQFAAEQEDVSLQEVAGSLRIVSRQAAAAASGSKEATAAFKRLGVDVKDANGNLKPQTQLLREIGAGLAKIPPGTERTAAGMKVLGRSAQAIIPLVTNLKELEAQAERLGLTVSADFARAADDFGDKLDQVRAIGRRAGVAIAETLLPVLNDLLTLTIEALIPALDLLKKTMNLLGPAIRGAADAFAFFATQSKRTGVAARLLAEGDLQGAIRSFTQLRANFSDVKNQADDAAAGLDGFNEGAGETKTALEQLVESFTKTEQAIAPVVTLAERLAGEFPALSPKFQELVTELQKVAATGPEAAKALEDVLALQARVQGEQESELRRDFERRTGTGAEGLAGLPQRAPSFREPGVQGPLTEAQAAGIGEPIQAADTEQLQQAPALLEESATMAEKLQAALTASNLESQGLNQTLADGQALLATMESFAGGFADALIATAEGGKKAFQEFFKGLLKDLARAIIRATVLQAILSIFSGGFSLAKIGAAVQKSLGLVAFAHQESSILGRAAQARGIEAIAGPSVAAGGTENVMTLAKSPNVIVREPGPFTVVEMTDRGVIPRMRVRQRRLNEEAF